jgi:hypothetical protein
MTKSSALKYCCGHWIPDPIDELDLLGPSNADGVPPHSRDRITVSLRNSAADADVIIERVYNDGLVISQFCGGGDR